MRDIYQWSIYDDLFVFTANKHFSRADIFLLFFLRIHRRHGGAIAVASKYRVIKRLTECIREKLTSAKRAVPGKPAWTFTNPRPLNIRAGSIGMATMFLRCTFVYIWWIYDARTFKSLFKIIQRTKTHCHKLCHFQWSHSCIHKYTIHWNSCKCHFQNCMRSSHCIHPRL